jgi:hypothetical protein
VTPPKTRSSEKFLRKTQEKKKFLRNPVRNAFLGPKNKFLKRGITNLADGRRRMADGSIGGDRYPMAVTTLAHQSMR